MASPQHSSSSASNQPSPDATLSKSRATKRTSARAITRSSAVATKASAPQKQQANKGQAKSTTSSTTSSAASSSPVSQKERSPMTPLPTQEHASVTAVTSQVTIAAPLNESSAAATDSTSSTGSPSHAPAAVGKSKALARASKTSPKAAVRLAVVEPQQKKVLPELSEEEKTYYKNYQFLTAKPHIYAINVGIQDLPHANDIKDYYQKILKKPICIVCAKLEHDMI
ncbi:MAG: hypothetical protein QW594_04170 [Candidatus Woesearchaeota archaeon]